MVIELSSLERKNYSASKFIASVTAKKLKITNTPNLSQLTCGMKVMDKLQEITDKTGLVFNISSFFRSAALNKATKGSPSSWHMQGLAVDGLFPKKTPKETVDIIKQSGVSVDKCFVEHACCHMQFNMDDTKNRNWFAYAELVNGVWVTKPLLN